MGAKQSALDVAEPQLKQEQGGRESAAPSRPADGAGPPRPPPLDLSAAGAPPPQRRRPPLCSAVDTVDIANTYPHSPAASPAATGLVDVWILAGQSNAVGENAADGTPIPHASQPLPGLVLAYDNSGTWRDAVPNVHLGVHGYCKQPSVGPDMAFARTLLALGLSTRVGLIATARGATSLFRDWRPGGGGGGLELYGSMIARTKAALAAPLPGGGSCRLRGMIWVQGEADAEAAVGAGPPEAYAANFTAFVQAVRRDLSSYHAQLPIIMGVMSVRKRGCFPYLAAVRQAQLNLSLPGLLQVDLAGYEFFEEYGGYHVHLTKDGCTALGISMAHAYYAAVVRAGLPRRTGEALILLAATPGGPHANQSGGGANGWKPAIGAALDAGPPAATAVGKKGAELNVAPTTTAPLPQPGAEAQPDDAGGVRIASGGDEAAVSADEVVVEEYANGTGAQTAGGVPTTAAEGDPASAEAAAVLSGGPVEAPPASLASAPGTLPGSSSPPGDDGSPAPGPAPAAPSNSYAQAAGVEPLEAPMVAGGVLVGGAVGAKAGAGGVRDP